MAPDEADAALSRELRYLARVEFVRRVTIEECALVAERTLAPKLSGDPDPMAMKVANAIRAVAQRQGVDK